MWQTARAVWPTGYGCAFRRAYRAAWVWPSPTIAECLLCVPLGSLVESGALLRSPPVFQYSGRNCRRRNSVRVIANKSTDRCAFWAVYLAQFSNEQSVWMWPAFWCHSSLPLRTPADPASSNTDWMPSEAPCSMCNTHCVWFIAVWTTTIVIKLSTPIRRLATLERPRLF